MNGTEIEWSSAIREWKIVRVFSAIHNSPLTMHGGMLMETPALLDLVRSILAQPTAPFHEDAVRTELLIQLAQCPHVTTEQDAFGNVVARYRRGDSAARYAFAAHMDHPAYVFQPIGSEDASPPSSASQSPAIPPGEGWEFLGGVPESYRAKNPPTRDFGAFAMWDLPACEIRDGRIHSRACDDLIGCVAIVALFRELEAAGAETHVLGLFTRAEEVGFVGAIQLARSELIPRDLTVVSLETSSERSQGAGKMGEGVILRVGDRTSIFDDTSTRALAAAGTEAGVAYQRCLMSGGTCEATAFQLAGYRSAALCVALGNYHNCGPDETIAPEFVAIDDVAGMIALMKAATVAPDSADPLAALRARLEKGLEEYRRYW